MSQLIENIAGAIREAERYCDLVQAFHHGDDLVVRDINRPFEQQVILRLPYADNEAVNMERLATCKAIIKGRAAAEAIRAALPEEARAALDAVLE